MLAEEPEVDSPLPYGPTNPPTEMEYMGYRYRIAGSDFQGESVYHYGDVGHIDQLIRLRQGLTYEQAVDTMLHEVVHVIWQLSGLGKKAKQEQVAGVVGTGLMHFLKQNPHIYEWIGSLLYAPDDEDEQEETE